MGFSRSAAPALFGWLLATLGGLGIVAPASADTLWWIAHAGTDDAADPMNWHIDPSHVNQLPDGTLRTFVTTAHHHGLHPDELQTWPRLETGELISRALYVGGWDVSLLEAFGDPVGQRGELFVAGGRLSTVAPTGSGCAYIRVGYNGADGLMGQSGGSVENCQFISLGFEGGHGLGVYELSGGELSGLGLDVGVTAGGILNQTGGSTDLGRTSVGRGYTMYADSRHYPSAGFFRLGDGLHRVRTLTLGAEEGAAGSALVQGGLLDANKILLGLDGLGALVQTGGEVRAALVNLGQGAGSHGQLSVSGGRLQVSRLEVGGGEGGRGQLTLVGAEADLALETLLVHGNGTLQFVADGSGWPTLETSGPITLEAGTTFDVRVAAINDEFQTPAWPEPALGTRYLLLRAQGGLTQQGVGRAGGSDPDWALSFGEQEISAVYYPCALRCDVNHDGGVNVFDFIYLRDQLGQSGVNDCNGDGVVGTPDFVVLREEMGQSCPAP